MNVYTLSATDPSYSLEFHGATLAAGKVGYNNGVLVSSGDLVSFLEAIAYFAAFCGNLDMITRAIPIFNSDNTAISLFQTTDLRGSFSLSLSNIPVPGKCLTQTVYDSTCGGTQEFVTVPYINQGNFCAVLGVNGSNPTKDFGNYVKFPIAYTVAGVPYDDYVYIGICKASKTDFYTPFEGFDYFVGFDVAGAQREAVNQNINQAVNTISKLPATLTGKNALPNMSLNGANWLK